MINAGHYPEPIKRLLKTGSL